MVHVNDQTINDEAVIPFGGMGAIGQRQPVRRRGEPRRRSPSGSGSRCATSRSRSRSRTDRARRGVDHRGGQAGRASRSRRRRASSRRRTTRSARRRGTACSMLPGPSTTCRTPSPAGCSRARSRSSGSSSTTSPTPTSPRSCAAWRTRPRRTASSSSPAARSAAPERESSYVRLLRSMRAAAVIFAGSGLDDAALNEELGRHVAGMEANGAAVVHLSPHPFGEPEVSVDNAGGIAAMVAALVGPRPSPDRVPRRADVPVRGARAARRLPARPRRRGARRRRAARGPLHASTARAGAIGVDTLLAGEAPVHRHLLRQRPARARRARAAGRAGDRRPAGRLGRAASTTSPWPAMTAPAPVDGAAAAARDGPPRLRLRRAPASPATRSGPRLLPTEVVLRDSTGRAAGRRRCRPAGAAPPPRTDAAALTAGSTATPVATTAIATRGSA